jgi:membrane associated rhomboid family serine protease
MEDNYAEEVKSLSTSELKEIAINFLMHRGLLVAAAKNELSIRGIALTEDEKEKIEEIKSRIRQNAIKSMEYKNATFPFDFKRETNDEPIYSLPQNHFQITPKEINSFFDLFIPTKGYFIAPILLNINILVFILMVFNGVNIFHPNVLLLQKWGANIRPLTLEGEWWRLLTSCFLHTSIFHLIGNMSALIYIGLLLEPLLGRLSFFSAYILTGITASLTSLCLHNMITSAGASGAIMGMYGVFLALLTTKLIELEKRNLLLE